MRGFNVAVKVLPFNQPRMMIGPGSIERLADHIGTYGFERLLLVTDRGITGLGLYSDCVSRLESQGIAVVIYDEVEPNPTERQIDKGIALAERERSEAVLGFGGGSAMDAAKVIAAGVTNDKPVAKMEGPFKIRKAPLPIFAVPTTSGTGAEVTVAAVVTNEADRRKYAVADHKLVPLAAGLDPEITRGLPPAITAATGMDALTHGIESYVSTRATPESRRASKATVRLVFRHLRNACANGDDLEAREGMALAAFEGGLSFTMVGLGYVHGIAHKLGGLYHLPHGLANAVTLPHVMEFSKTACASRYADLARAIGLDDDGAPASDAVLADRFIEAVRGLSREIGIPETLSEIRPGDVPAIATAAIDEAFDLYGVPRYMEQHEAEQVVRRLCA
ncbi:MAG: iron-containing alcohol dehydrogenase [Solirubrobacterales bacterium]